MPRARAASSVEGGLAVRRVMRPELPPPDRHAEQDEQQDQVDVWSWHQVRQHGCNDLGEEDHQRHHKGRRAQDNLRGAASRPTRTPRLDQLQAAEAEQQDGRPQKPCAVGRRRQPRFLRWRRPRQTRQAGSTQSVASALSAAVIGVIFSVCFIGLRMRSRALCGDRGIRAPPPWQRTANLSLQ